MTKNRKEEPGGSHSPEADVERVHVACCTNPSGEILAEPFILFQERRSLSWKCTDPTTQASDRQGLLRTPPSLSRRDPAQREAGMGEGRDQAS